MKKYVYLLVFALMVTSCVKKVKKTSTVSDKPTVPVVAINEPKPIKLPKIEAPKIITEVPVPVAEQPVAEEPSQKNIPESVSNELLEPAVVVPKPSKPSVVAPIFVFRDVFFDFDKSDLRVEAVNTLTSDVLKGNALQQNRMLTIFGYCDPRGTEKYNYELGLRRAKMVRQFLIDIGYPSSLIKIKSFGKSKAIGTNEKTWQLDRRAEVKIDK